MNEGKSPQPMKEAPNHKIDNSLSVINSAISGLEYTLSIIKNGDIPQDPAVEGKPPTRPIALIIEQIPTDIVNFADRVKKVQSELESILL